jgi:hypothetical protein
MKQLLFVIVLAIVNPSLLTGCEKTPSPDIVQKQKQKQKQKQQAEEDKKAMDGGFKKSDGKSY